MQLQQAQPLFESELAQAIEAKLAITANDFNANTLSQMAYLDGRIAAFKQLLGE